MLFAAESRSVTTVTSNGGDMKGTYGLAATIALWPWTVAASAPDTASASNEDQGTLTEIVVIARRPRGSLS
jgi:hypothetical protein